MNLKVIELTVDLAKQAMPSGQGGHIADPKNLLKFLDETARKLQALLEEKSTNKS